MVFQRLRDYLPEAWDEGQTSGGRGQILYYTQPIADSFPDLFEQSLWRRLYLGAGSPTEHLCEFSPSVTALSFFLWKIEMEMPCIFFFLRIGVHAFDVLNLMLMDTSYPMHQSSH